MKKSGEILYSLRRYDHLDNNFTQISNDVFKLTNGNEFKVYSYLCCNYNKALGYSFPSLNTIAKNTIQKCIKRLEELGLIKIGKFENKINKYTNNVYKVFIPIIVKNELEEKEEEDIRQMLDQMVKDTEGKIYVYTFEEKEE